MKKYILKRILLFIPTLFIISLLAFAISTNAPGDPVARMTVTSHDGGEEANSNTSAQKEFWNRKLGLTLPLFYFELSDWSSPDTLYRISDKEKRETLARLLHGCGNWAAVAKYASALQNLSISLNSLKTDTFFLNQKSATLQQLNLNSSIASVNFLRYTHINSSIVFQFKKLDNSLAALKHFKQLSVQFNALKQCYQGLSQNKSIWKTYLPTMHFHPQNQYHRWIFGDSNMFTGSGSAFTKGIIRGDFGTSFASKEPVSDKIWKRIKVSLLFSLLSILLAYLISIPIALKAAEKPQGVFDTGSSLVLFALYALPSFFVATLLLMTFSNPDVLNWFPASGLQPATGIAENTSIIERLRIQIPYLVLPLICYVYSSLAFLSRSTRAALLENLPLEYIRTARAKGLSERRVLYKHAFKNALLPLITLFANVFPYALGGSVILESIFTLPGMGLETFTAIQNQDYPVIVCVFTLAGCMTVVGALLADLLYAFVDPRILFHKTR
ncbi:MAG: ABC transporter permease [Bacteroidetes bacterium]|nr:ABC transporter permease [Bacteroidota bacterium]